MLFTVVSQRVGPGADYCLGVSKFFRFGNILPYVLGNDRLGSSDILQERAVRLAQIQLHRVFVNGFSRLNDSIVNPLIGVFFGIVKGEDHILSGKLGAIMPPNIVL